MYKKYTKYVKCALMSMPGRKRKYTMYAKYIH